MKKFIRKPVEVDVWEFDGTEESIKGLPYASSFMPAREGWPAMVYIYGDGGPHLETFEVCVADRDAACRGHCEDPDLGSYPATSRGLEGPAECLEAAHRIAAHTRRYISSLP